MKDPLNVPAGHVLISSNNTPTWSGLQSSSQTFFKVSPWTIRLDVAHYKPASILPHKATVMLCYHWLNSRFESVSYSPSPAPLPPIYLLHLPPSNFSLQVSLLCLSFFCLLYPWAFWLLNAAFSPTPTSLLFLPSPPLFTLTHSFTLGPNYEIASNKYMYFFSCEGGKNLAPHFLFF